MAAKFYNVYVILLDAGVLKHSRFMKRNPGYRARMPCAYVGSSYQNPDARFDQHKAGYRSNRYARKYGLRLIPEEFERYNPIPSRADAEEIEAYVAARLRDRGWGIWQG